MVLPLPLIMFLGQLEGTILVIVSGMTCPKGMHKALLPRNIVVCLVRLLVVACRCSSICRNLRIWVMVQVRRVPLAQVLRGDIHFLRLLSEHRLVQNGEFEV